ncbi:unnamed protein product, partial [Amoebophrya sp. A120]|eukprot:GSA120T00014405001.1
MMQHAGYGASSATGAGANSSTGATLTSAPSASVSSRIIQTGGTTKPSGNHLVRHAHSKTPRGRVGMISSPASPSRPLGAQRKSNSCPDIAAMGGAASSEQEDMRQLGGNSTSGHASQMSTDGMSNVAVGCRS